MSLRVATAAHYVMPVAPVVRIRARTGDETPAHDDKLAAAGDDVARWTTRLQRHRSDALAELAVATPSRSGLERVRTLHREQLAAMVYDQDGRFSLDERSSALARLQSNDREFLQRAGDMAQASGDERVLQAALIELEEAKTPIERALPTGEQAPDVAALRRSLASRTLELGGAPASLSLAYPNGFAAQAAPAALAAVASPGAAHVTQLYRDSLF